LNLITLKDTNTVGRFPLDEGLPRQKISTLKHTTFQRERHPCPDGIQIRKLTKWAAADLCLWPRDYWDWSEPSYYET